MQTANFPTRLAVLVPMLRFIGAMRVARRGVSLASALLLAGPPLLAHGDLHERIAQISGALEQRPGDPALLLGLATLYCDHEEWQLTLRTLGEIRATDESLRPIDALRGRALCGLGRPDEALACLNRAVERQPQDPRVRRDRARVLARLGRSDEALADFRAAWSLTAMPTPELAAEVAAALARQERPEEALEVLESALARLGREPALLQQALDLDRALARTDSALRRLDALQSLAPQPEPWMAERAELLARAGRDEAARREWRALSDRIAAMPNLQRGLPAARALAARAQRGLAEQPAARRAPTSAAVSLSSGLPTSVSQP